MADFIYYNFILVSLSEKVFQALQIGSILFDETSCRRRPWKDILKAFLFMFCFQKIPRGSISVLNIMKNHVFGDLGLD